MGKNIIDRAVEAVAPVHAVKRTAARRALSFVNSGYGNYGANTTKKSMRGWEFRGGSEKEDIEDNLDILRQRSRDAFMGVPVARAALKTLQENTIAGGLMPAPQVDGSFLGLTDEQTDTLQAQILREFDLWADSRECDYTGADDFYKLQQLAYLSYLMNGDVFALLRVDPESLGPYQLQVQLIEADRICSPDLYDRLTPCEVQGYKVYSIVQGVETDENGVVVAYWICNRHPLSAAAYDGTMSWARVEARGAETGRRNILHVMSRERVGQRRGVPRLAPVLETLKQLGRYTDAEIDAAVISSMFTVFVQPESVTDERPFGEMQPPETLADAMDRGTFEMATGAIIDLNPGEKVNFADPKHPSSGFDKFSDAIMKQVGMALGAPIEVMQKQFTTSYSAARGALNEFWRVCDMERDNFISDFCQPLYEEFMAEAVALGRVNAPGFFKDPATRKAYMSCAWNGPARTNLNPVQEVEAAERRVYAGFSTAQQEAAQMTGGNYGKNIRQRLIEAEQMKKVREITGQDQAALPSGRSRSGKQEGEKQDA